MSRRFPGPFTAQGMGTGAWHLVTAEPGGPEIFLQGVTAAAGATLAAGPVETIELNWEGRRVTLVLAGAHRDGTLAAGSALVHEPQPLLYQALPLAGFDSSAKRFWRRVFLLIRIPGGRWLVRAIARRKRRPPAAE